MTVLSLIVRMLSGLLSLPLLLLGAMGLLWAHLPQSGAALWLSDATFSVVANLIGMGAPDPLHILSPDVIEDGLSGAIPRIALSLIGLAMFVFAVKPRSERVSIESDEEAPSVEQLPPVEKKLRNKTAKQAAQLARKGSVKEAGEMLFSVGMMDKAADYFVQAEEFVLAAEVRHDQNRFEESAEFYLKAGAHEPAAGIYAQLENWQKAGDCYAAIDSKSLAAEMYEKAEDFKKAADCYHAVEFLRHAARCYVKCQTWLPAAECLAQVYSEEAAKAGNTDPVKSAELRKMAIQSGRLFMKGKEPERAMAILEKGDCQKEAGEVALKLGQFGKASELFRDAGDLPRAAEALRELGETEAAARILGEHHRDMGEIKESARWLEEAGDFLEAGDLYRQLEEYESAGNCYRRQSDYRQAAEMFKVAGDRVGAAESFEEAECFTEAAECWALEGNAEREAQLLEQAGEFLSAGEVYHREGRDEQAIKVLQKLEPGAEGFARAAALLGDIFRARGQLSLAIKKLKQAIGESEIERDNLEVFYVLATLYESNEDWILAVELFEKILAFDYHYGDVEERLAAARIKAEEAGPPVTAGSPEGGTGRPIVPSATPGRYKITGELGRGGMGIVYRAEDTALDRTVAFKVLPDGLKENVQALNNFLREAKAAAKLNHPGIVTVYDTGEQDGRFYIAMEYVDGTTLKEILKRRGVISPAGILHVLVQVCEAMAYAHETGVVHRDIKSANTMWTRDKKAKIMDFGLARVAEEVRNHTTVVSGTPYYMSPEQTLGRNIDHRTDIYSLGVTIFEMATGSVPFREGNIPYHHVHTAPPDVRDLRPELPAGLAAVVNKCLQKDPAARYQSTREILAEVKASLGQASTRTS